MTMFRRYPIQPSGVRFDPPEVQFAEHGKTSTLYSRYGCRCQECVANQRARQAAAYARRKALA